MILMICIMFLSVLPSASPDEWTKSFKLEGTAKLRVDTSDANIRVTTCDCSTVEAQVTTQGWTIGGDGINISDRQSGDQIDIEVRFPRQAFQMSWRNRRVDIEIRVPRATVPGTGARAERPSAKKVEARNGTYFG